jgi:hypothetical protein
MRGIWEQLSTSVKNNIWNYVQIICLLAEKIMSGNVLASHRDALIKSGKIH